MKAWKSEQKRAKSSWSTKVWRTHISLMIKAQNLVASVMFAKHTQVWIWTYEIQDKAVFVRGQCENTSFQPLRRRGIPKLSRAKLSDLLICCSFFHVNALKMQQYCENRYFSKNRQNWRELFNPCLLNCPSFNCEFEIQACILFFARYVSARLMYRFFLRKLSLFRTEYSYFSPWFHL